MSGSACVRVLPALLTALCSFWFALPTAAQCANDWSVGLGASAEVRSVIEWDPDGAGPATPLVALGGTFTSAGGIAANRVVAWDPATDTWSPLGAGLDGPVEALAALPNGDLVAGGSFTASGATPLTSIARWDGTAWQPLGSGIPIGGLGTAVVDLVVLPDGDLVAGGTFLSAGGVAVNNVARWDGTAWSAMGAGVPYPGVRAMIGLRDGGVLASHGSGVARWTPTSSWTFVGNPGAYALHEMANGDVLAVGQAGLMRANGSTWTSISPGFAGGSFFGPSFGPMVELPNGDLVVGGHFASSNGQSLPNLARWDGSAWQPFGTGTNGPVAALCFLQEGTLLVGGAFTTAGGLASNNFARLGTTCPATATTFAAGCPGSGGSNLLEARTLPWVDGTLHTRGSGLASPAVVAVDTGLSPLVPGFPLANVFAEAPVGCELHLVPLIVQSHVSLTGTVDNTLFLPNTPPLVGVTFYQQMFAFEVGGTGFVEITASNALALTAGRF